MTTSKNVDLSVVVPIYNEEGHITNCPRELTESLDTLGFTYEILLVDDGSKD